MNPYTQFALLTASSLRMIPHIAFYLAHKKVVDKDLSRYGEGDGGVVTFIKVCTRQRVFRNLFYYRLGEYRSVFIKWLMPPERTLNIWCPSIGEGCHFEHNYATYLNAESIGDNFYCLQLVTLGNDKNGKRPTIGNNVKILLNGISASDIDLKGIPANKIVKVEYYNIPPARYADAGTLINVITKKLDNGVNAGVEQMQQKPHLKHTNFFSSSNGVGTT